MILKAILLLALPIAVFTIGAWTMERLVGRQQVKEQLDKAAAEHRKPLNMRVAGYDVAEVERHWGALDDAALGVERRKIDWWFGHRAPTR